MIYYIVVKIIRKFRQAFSYARKGRTLSGNLNNEEKKRLLTVRFLYAFINV